MKLLPISDGIAVKIESIEKIERISELQTRVYCGFESYDVTLPYDIVVNIIENSGNDGRNDGMLKEISQKIGNLPVFAG